MITLLLPLALTAGFQGAPAKPATVPALPIQPHDDAPAPKVGKPAELKLDIDPIALDMDALRKNHLGYYPSGAELIDDKPTGILKEPTYEGKPKYGAIRLGNGPKAVTYLVVDEVKGGKSHIYLDLNGNGDLTDDGSSDWDSVKESNGVTNLQKQATLRASWGDALVEKESAPYAVLLYRRQGDPRINFVRYAARKGTLEINGKQCTVLLAENQSDGIFTVPHTGDLTRKPVILFVDEDGDGLFSGSEQHNLGEPFQIDGAWYQGFPNVSGSELALRPSSAGGATPRVAAAKPKPLLTAGVPAPDFEALTPDGKPIHLSDFKGKTVLLDFWATWCGPCQASMPGLQKIYDQVKSQNVVVLSLNVFDAKDPFDEWIKTNSGTKYNFTFAFDPAMRDHAKSIAASKFNVTGIPTMYIIKPDGTVATSIVGSGNEANIVKALGDLGVKATVPPAEKTGE